MVGLTFDFTEREESWFQTAQITGMNFSLTFSRSSCASSLRFALLTGSLPNVKTAVNSLSSNNLKRCFIKLMSSHQQT